MLKILTNNDRLYGVKGSTKTKNDNGYLNINTATIMFKK